MKKSVRIIIVTMCAAATLTVFVATHPDAVRYLCDLAMGYYIDTAERLFPSGGYTAIDHARYRRYLRTFSDCPDGFIHAGGILLYRAAETTELDDLAAAAVRYTTFFRARALAAEIRSWNALKESSIPAGRTIIIPSPLPSQILDIRNKTNPPLIEARGLYFSAAGMGSGLLLNNLDRYRSLGINAVVFDAKDIPGIVTYYSRVPLVRRLHTDEERSIDDINKFIRILESKGFYTIARIAVFHDHLLRKRDPSAAIQSRRGGAWDSGSKERWCDPTNRMVQDYNIALAVELASLGCDEIQFDYIRFPTTGNQAEAAFRYDFGKMTRDEAIAHFLKRAREALAAHHTRLSIDIFGVVAWGKEIDIARTGQRIDLLARHCDVISPMLYPSHFNDNFDGYARPGDNPYYFIYEGCRKVTTLADNRAIIRPWLQAFAWRVSDYGSGYILTQIRAAKDAGAKGYLFWNAANDYNTVIRALEKGAADKQSRADTRKAEQ